jgi:hypothetical protein
MLVTGQRVKYLKLTQEMMVGLLSLNGQAVTASGFPPGAKIAGHAYDDEDDNIVFIIEHPDFPEVSTPDDMEEVVVSFVVKESA